MPAYEHQDDLRFTPEGDFRLSLGGDLARTGTQRLQGLVQRIHKRVMSSRGDWALEGQVGAGLGEFVGQPNNRETARLVQSRIVSELLQDNLLYGQDLKVQVVPLGPRQILLSVRVRVESHEGYLDLQYTYDLRDNLIVPRNL